MKLCELSEFVLEKKNECKQHSARQQKLQCSDLCTIIEFMHQVLWKKEQVNNQTIMCWTVL